MKSFPQHTFVLSDGRQLAFHLYGLPTGKPVYIFHGFPGSRIQAAFLHEKAEAAGICLISADRPGFGYSSPDKNRTLRSWAKDVEALADHLGHQQFAVIGISCGGTYALACAHQLPQRITRVILMAGMGPMDIPAIRKNQLPILTCMFALAKKHPLLASPLLVVDRILFRTVPNAAVKFISKMLPLPDQQLLQNNPDIARAFGASLAEAYRQGFSGVLREAHLIGIPRDFALDDIKVPVMVYQGGKDRHVPKEMGRFIAQSLPQSTLHFFPDEGHLSIVWNRFDDCVNGINIPVSINNQKGGDGRDVRRQEVLSELH
jgi:pimeloyl-ACP methyl ester carboxylesterase